MGAHATFNQSQYMSFLRALRDKRIMKDIPHFTFDHAVKDPVSAIKPILPKHRLIPIEGLYTLLDRPGWRDCAAFDLRVWIEIDRDTARERLMARNFEAGISPDLTSARHRVEPVESLNGEEVREHRVTPTDVVYG